MCILGNLTFFEDKICVCKRIDPHSYKERDYHEDKDHSKGVYSHEDVQILYWSDAKKDEHDDKASVGIGKLGKVYIYINTSIWATNS